MSELRLGLLDIVLLPFSLPLKAAWLGIQKSVELASEQEEQSHGRLETLADLQAAYELGEISEGQYQAMWAELDQD